MSTVDHYIKAATRHNTRLAYQAAVRHFEEEWGGYLPATADSVARYLVDHARTLSQNTLKQRLAALSRWHLDQGFPDPTKAPHVRQVLKGIRELHPAKEKQARPLQLEQLAQLDRWIEAELAVHPPGSGQCLRLMRDRALILLGFWRGFRSDELCRLQVEHIVVEPGAGISLFLPRSKGDRGAQGRTFRTPALKALCPVRAFEQWLQAAGLNQGPVFRHIDQWGHVSDQALNARSIIPLLRRCFEAAGIPLSETYSSHSLRRGFATWANASGWDLKALMDYVGWRDMKAALRYVESTANFGSLETQATEALPSRSSTSVARAPVDDSDSWPTAVLDLHLSVQRYHKHTRGLAKVREQIERICLKTYSMRCLSRERGHYRLRIAHESAEHLDRLIADLLTQMQEIADSYDFFIEAHLENPVSGQRWD